MHHQCTHHLPAAGYKEYLWEEHTDLVKAILTIKILMQVNWSGIFASSGMRLSYLANYEPKLSWISANISLEKKQIY